MGVNSLPKTVTRQRRDCDFNPGPSAPVSSTLITRLPSYHKRSCKSGPWTGREFHQQVRAVRVYIVVKRCPRLVAPPNGHMSCTKDDFSYDTQCHFTCNPGYKLVGSKSQACLAIAAWSGIPPKCRGESTATGNEHIHPAANNKAGCMGHILQHTRVGLMSHVFYQFCSFYCFHLSVSFSGCICVCDCMCVY